MPFFVDMNDVPVEYTLEDFHRDRQHANRIFVQLGHVVMEFMAGSSHWFNFNTGWMDIEGPEYYVEEASLITFTFEDIKGYCTGNVE